MPNDFDELLAGLDSTIGPEGVDVEQGINEEAVDPCAPRNATEGRKPKPKTPREAAGLEKAPLTARSVRRKSKCLDLSRVKAATDQIGSLPGPDESLHCIMGGDFNGLEIVPAIIDLAGEPAETLYLTTLGFNLAVSAQLCGMIDEGRIRSATVLCSEYFAKVDPKVYAAALVALETRGQRLKAIRNHSKIILAQCGARFFVVETSANLRTCNNI